MGKKPPRGTLKHIPVSFKPDKLLETLKNAEKPTIPAVDESMTRYAEIVKGVERVIMPPITQMVEAISVMVESGSEPDEPAKPEGGTMMQTDALPGFDIANPAVRIEFIRRDAQQLFDDLMRARLVQGRCDSLQNDILHKVEFEDLDDEEALRVNRELTDVRRLRRRAKDAMEILEPVCAVLGRCAVMAALEQAVREAEKKAAYLSNRKYIPRCSDIPSI